MEETILYYKYINLLNTPKRLDLIQKIIDNFNNHILIIGNKGCGKMYFVNELLNSINGSKLNIKKKNETIKMKSKKIDFNINYSNIHTDIDLSLYNKYDKFIVSEYINDIVETAPIITNKFEYNIILLRHFDKLTFICYQSLLRLFEKTYDTTRFICVIDNMKAIDPALLSRFFIIKIPEIDISSNLYKIINSENIKINEDNLNDLIEISNNNYREMLYRIDAYRNGGNIYTNTELNINKCVKLLKNKDINVLLIIRDLLYLIINNNLDYDDIINKIRYFINKSINKKYLNRINENICNIQRKIQCSVRQFYYIENIMIHAYYIIHNENE